MEGWEDEDGGGGGGGGALSTWILSLDEKHLNFKQHHNHIRYLEVSPMCF